MGFVLPNRVSKFMPLLKSSNNVSITNNCFFGANCTIKNGVKVSSYTFVGASTYINKDTSDYSFYACNEKEPKILDISRII